MLCSFKDDRLDDRLLDLVKAFEVKFRIDLGDFFQVLFELFLILVIPLRDANELLLCLPLLR